MNSSPHKHVRSNNTSPVTVEPHLLVLSYDLVLRNVNLISSHINLYFGAVAWP